MPRCGISGAKAGNTARAANSYRAFSQRTFRSTDGGNTWTGDYTAGQQRFPEETVWPAGSGDRAFKRQRIYAFVESPDSALFVSDDGGATWEKRDKSQWMVWRPFYFANLTIDPKNPDRLFKPDGALIVSEDAGKTCGGRQFSRRAWRRHDVWIDPTNPQVVFVGDDGGDVLFV